MAAAKKKDFSNVNTARVYDAIGEATADPVEPAAPAEPTAQPASEGRKERKTYTAEEAIAFMDGMNTAGRKGVKMPRINMAFTPESYDYVKTMAQVSGITLTDFVNRIVQQHLNEHREQYERALEFRRSI